MRFACFFNAVNQRKFFLIFLIPYLMLVMFVYKDFGIAIDEPIEYQFGKMLYNRNFGRDPVLLKDFAVEKPNSREIWAYNHFHAMLLYMINDSESFEIYHFLNLIFAVIAFFMVYELVYQQTHKPFLSLLGPICLFFLPRFTGDIASNVKDPVYSVFLLVVLVMIIITEKWKRFWWRGIVIGLTIGILAAARFLGYSMIVLYGLFKFLRLLSESKISTKNFRLLFIEILIICITSVVVHAVQMPFVAANPVKGLFRLSQIAQEYPWNGTMLYRGNEIVSGNLPWHYVFVWLGATTPIYIIIFWILSHRFFKEKIFQLLHLVFWGNLLLYFLVKPVIYDGIRHLLFLEVIMALLASLSWVTIWIQHKKIRVLLAITLMVFGFSMIKQYNDLHPYQYIYFNQFTNGLPGAFGKFETDYWGLSFKEGAIWLSKFLDDKDDTKIGICGNWESRFYFSNTNHLVAWFPHCESIGSDITYVLANGRANDWDKITGEEIFTVKRQNIPLMKVYKLY